MPNINQFKRGIGPWRQGVILLCLRPHTSHILQPLDVSFFRPLKADLPGLTGDLSPVSFKGPKGLLPEAEGSKSGGDWVQEVGPLPF